MDTELLKSIHKYKKENKNSKGHQSNWDECSYYNAGKNTAYNIFNCPLNEQLHLVFETLPSQPIFGECFLQNGLTSMYVGMSSKKTYLHMNPTLQIW